MGEPRFDFWLGEPVTPVARYTRRHQRDALCLSCSRAALPGFSRCRRHLVTAAEAGRRFRRNLTAAGDDGAKTDGDSSALLWRRPFTEGGKSHELIY